MNTESDFVANSSQGGRNQSSKNVAEKYDDKEQRGRDDSDYSLTGMDEAKDDGDDDTGVRSVVAFVKENREIWQ